MYRSASALAGLMLLATVLPSSADGILLYDNVVRDCRANPGSGGVEYCIKTVVNNPKNLVVSDALLTDETKKQISEFVQHRLALMRAAIESKTQVLSADEAQAKCQDDPGGLSYCLLTKAHREEIVITSRRLAPEIKAFLATLAAKQARPSN